jgi:hypothetical protein
VYNYDQKPAPPRQPLITPENAQGIIQKFKAANAGLGNPRFIIYINPGVTAAPVEPAGAHQTNGAANLPVLKQLPLADRQTMRDIERLFGRPLRMAEANLVDQQVATQAMAAHNAASLKGQSEQSQSAREALSKVADVAIEVLISSRNITVPELSGEDRIYALPDIQATAIHLKDSKIVGQATSSDALRGDPAYLARNYGVEEITETTALALMEDMLTSAAKAPAESK